MNNIQFKTLTINLDEKICFLDNIEIKLTKTEFNLLAFLLSNRNKIYSRKELMQYVWDPGITVTGRAVDTTISRLRKKLKELGKHIITRLGFGYGFKEDI